MTGTACSLVPMAAYSVLGLLWGSAGPCSLGVTKGILTSPCLKIQFCGRTGKLGGRLGLKDEIQCRHNQRKGRTVYAARKQVLWLKALCRMSPLQHHLAVGPLNHVGSIPARVGWSSKLGTCTCSASTGITNAKLLLAAKEELPIA